MPHHLLMCHRSLLCVLPEMNWCFVKTHALTGTAAFMRSVCHCWALLIDNLLSRTPPLGNNFRKHTVGLHQLRSSIFGMSQSSGWEIMLMYPFGMVCRFVISHARCLTCKNHMIYIYNGCLVINSGWMHLWYTPWHALSVLMSRYGKTHQILRWLVIPC